MKRILLFIAIATVAFSSASAQRKASNKSLKKTSAETITIPNADSVKAIGLMKAYLISHPQTPGAADLLNAITEAEEKPGKGATDTCAFVSAGEHYLQGATWKRTNGHLLVGIVSNLRDAKFYDFNPATQVMTADRAVGVPITSILGGDWTISFNTDGFHCSVVRLTGYGTYFNFNGEKFVVAKQDLGENPSW